VELSLSWLVEREVRGASSSSSSFFPLSPRLPPSSTSSKKKKKTPTSQQSKGCSNATEPEIAALFTKWNDKLKTQDPDQIVPLYAEKSVLLPTLSNTPRLTPETKHDYFVEFMTKKPAGTILTRTIFVSCETAMDTGTYEFTLTDKKTGEKSKVPARYTYTYDISAEDKNDWKITSHHSSAMPEQPAPASA
jgi:uncharacterized protein (TIGR02246 family)